MGCLNCGKELVHTPGKRQKKFCTTSCRSSYGQKKKRGNCDLVFRKPGRPKKNHLDHSILLGPTIQANPVPVYDAPKKTEDTPGFANEVEKMIWEQEQLLKKR